MHEHEVIWDQVRKALLDARHDLPDPRGHTESAAVPVGTLSGTLVEFEEFLDHDELELAWDALATVAERMNASRQCWQKLTQAAGLMNLGNKESWSAAKGQE